MSTALHGVGYGAHELTNLDGTFDIVQAMRKSDSQAANPHSGLVFADGCGLVSLDSRNSLLLAGPFLHLFFP